MFCVLNPSPVYSLVQQIWDADNECWKLSMNEMTEFNLFILPMRALRIGFWDGMTDQSYSETELGG